MDDDRRSLYNRNGADVSGHARGSRAAKNPRELDGTRKTAGPPNGFEAVDRPSAAERDSESAIDAAATGRFDDESASAAARAGFGEAVLAAERELMLVRYLLP
jgi:hypothetical protein